MDAINTINIIAKLYKQELAEANYEKYYIKLNAKYISNKSTH